MREQIRRSRWNIHPCVLHQFHGAEQASPATMALRARSTYAQTGEAADGKANPVRPQLTGARRYRRCVTVDRRAPDVAETTESDPCN